MFFQSLGNDILGASEFQERHFETERPCKALNFGQPSVAR